MSWESDERTQIALALCSGEPGRGAMERALGRLDSYVAKHVEDAVEDAVSEVRCEHGATIDDLCAAVGRMVNSGTEDQLARAEAKVARVQALVANPSGERKWEKQGRSGYASTVDCDDLRRALYDKDD